MQEKARREPHGKHDPRVGVDGLPAPDEHGDECGENDRFEEGHHTKRSGRTFHLIMRHLVDCVGSVAVAGFVHVDEAESALEEFLDVRFADEFGSEEFVEFEIGEAAVGDFCRQDFEKALGVDRAESADFFEHDALRVVDEFFGIDETAKFYPRDRFDEDGAQQAQ